MRLICLLVAALLIGSCGTVQNAVQDEIAKASVNRSRLDPQEMRACADALRRAGHRDIVRVTGGTSEYNHSAQTTVYYPRFLLSGGGWGTAVIKVTGAASEPTLLVVDVERFDRHAGK